MSCWEYSKFNEKFGSVLEEDELEILREFVAIDGYGNGYFDNVFYRQANKDDLIIGDCYDDIYHYHGF